MNYRRIYDLLILHASTRTEIPSSIERHHILPKSMGGNNKKENIVFLTPREHYIAHHLLWKIYKNVSMQRAFWCMMVVRSKDRKYKIGSRTYESMKILQALDMSMRRMGVKESDKTREKKSKSHTGLKRGPSPLKGTSMPIGISWFVKCPHCDIQGTMWNMKRYHFENCKIINPNRIIESKSKGRSLTTHKCLHCDIETSMGNLKRWHLDNCKYKENNSVR